VQERWRIRGEVAEARVVTSSRVGALWLTSSTFVSPLYLLRRKFLWNAIVVTASQTKAVSLAPFLLGQHIDCSPKTNSTNLSMASRPRHILITGGSRGIGLAIAQLFSKNAYRCTLISRSEEDLKTAVASLSPLPFSAPQASLPNTEASEPSETPNLSYQHGHIAGNISHGSAFWASDTSSPFAARLPRPDTRKYPTHPSHIDVVVNCAGMTQAKLFSTLKEEDIDSIIKTNLTSMMQGTKFLLRYCNPLNSCVYAHVGSFIYMHIC
jgi:hypothetical protein